MKLSIVIPTYNGEKYIKETLISILNQTIAADEIIISDDGSTDNTISIIHSIFDDFNKTSSIDANYIIKLNPAGPSGFVNGWNRGISFATGDFISILHQDDLLEPEFIKNFKTAYQRYSQVRHFFVPCNYIDNNGNIIHRFTPPQSGLVLYTGNKYMKAYQKCYGIFPHIHRCPGVVTHRAIFEQGCLYNSYAGHIADDDFFFRVGKFTDVVGIMEPLVAYRLHDLSETANIGDLKLVSRLANDYLYQIKQWRGSDFIDATAMEYFFYHALKYKNRLLAYGIKKNKPELIVEGLSLSNLLLNQGCIDNSISILILEKFLKINFISPIIQKIIRWFYK